MYYITICIAIADFIHIAHAYEAGILDSANSRTIYVSYDQLSYIFKSKLVPLLHRKHTIGQVQPIAKQTDQPTCIQSLIRLLMKCH